MGGRKPGLTPDALDKARSALLLYESKKKTVDKIAKDLGISRATCYRYIEAAKEIEEVKREKSKYLKKVGKEPAFNGTLL